MAQEVTKLLDLIIFLISITVNSIPRLVCVW